MAQEAVTKVTLTTADVSSPSDDIHAVMENAELKGSLLQHQVILFKTLQ